MKANITDEKLTELFNTQKHGESTQYRYFDGGKVKSIILPNDIPTAEKFINAFRACMEKIQ